MKKLVSVVVLNWNGKDHLRICLNSLKKNSYKPLEVIVVDNNSYDGSVDMVENNFPWVRLIRNEKNLGYSGGNNIGIKESRGEYIFILNNDTQVPKDFLQPLVMDLESDSKIACVQPKIVYGHNHNFLNAVGSYFTSTGFLYHYGYRKSAKLKKYNKKLHIYSAKGAGMLVRKSALNKVGLFDEDFFIFFEETDLCHRFWLAGFTVEYEPSSIIYHYEAVDTNRQMNNFRRNFLSLRNRICSFIKNLETINLLKVIVALCIIYLISFFYSLIRFRFYLSLAIILSIIWNVLELQNTLEKRFLIQRKIRKINDATLFRIVKKDPPIRYYYYLFLGNLKDFVYEKDI